MPSAPLATSVVGSLAYCATANGSSLSALNAHQKGRLATGALSRGHIPYQDRAAQISRNARRLMLYSSAISLNSLAVAITADARAFIQRVGLQASPLFPRQFTGPRPILAQSVRNQPLPYFAAAVVNHLNRLSKFRSFAGSINASKRGQIIGNAGQAGAA